jgi:hypothetical protein
MGHRPEEDGFDEGLQFRLRLGLWFGTGKSIVDAPIFESDDPSDEEVMARFRKQVAYLEEHLELYLRDRERRKTEWTLGDVFGKD